MTFKEAAFSFFILALVILLVPTCGKGCSSDDQMSCEVEWVFTMTGKYEPVMKCQRKDAGDEMD